MEIKGRITVLCKCFFASAIFSAVFNVASAAAYTVTYNSTFGEFDGGVTTNIVEYNDDHTVKSGEYKEPVYNTGIDSSDFITWYSEYDAKNRVNLDEISSDTTVYAAYEKVTWRWGYTGNEQTFALPITAGLQLKVWGAQGGTSNNRYGGYGGYSTGLYDFLANQTIYVYVGEQATSATGGFNGGGDATAGASWSPFGGGGATHIATATGLLSELESDKDSVAIVAGAGGGAHKYAGYYSATNGGANGGHGGGYIGGTANTCLDEYTIYALGGTQEAGGRGYSGAVKGRDGSFGKGGNYNSQGSGGGAGWYGGGGGGYQSGNIGSGAGGSGYIGNTVAETRHMAAYDDQEKPPCSTATRPAFTSDDEPTKTIATTNASEVPIEDYAKLGNGYAMAELTRLNIRYVNEFDNTDFTKDQYVGSLAQEFTITQRPGYTAAWYKGDVVWDFNDPVNFDTTLEVKYTPITYNLTYNLGTGTLSEANPATYTIESDDITLNNPTAPEYYTFFGWSGTNLTGDENLTVIIPKGSVGDRSYTANIAPTPYSINYGMDGGTNDANNPTTYNYESNEIALARPTKEGYTFLGWSGTGIDSEDNLDVTIPVQSHGDREYTAHWSINRYTATFNVNGGAAADYTIINGDYGVAFGTLPVTSRTGYNFLGWFTEQNDGTEISASTTMPAENHTYYAHWEIIEYTITYDLGGEDQDSSPINSTENPGGYTVENSNITLKPATPGDSWHNFVGWALSRETEEGLTDDFVIDTSEVKNITVYAIFQANPYTVTFDPDNGEATTEKAIVGTEPVGELPEDPEKAGYEFLGWFVNGKKIDETFTSRVDVTAIARWKLVPTVPDTGANFMTAVFSSSSVIASAISGALIALFTCRKKIARVIRIKNSKE